MQLGFQIYGGSLSLLRVRRTVRRSLAVKPRGMECSCLARRNRCRRNSSNKKNDEFHKKSQEIRAVGKQCQGIKMKMSVIEND